MGFGWLNCGWAAPDREGVIYLHLLTWKAPATRWIKTVPNGMCWFNSRTAVGPRWRTAFRWRERCSPQCEKVTSGDGVWGHLCFSMFSTFHFFFIVFFVNPKRHKTRVLCSYYWVAHIIINHLHSLILIFLSLFSKQLVSLEYGQEMPYSPDYRCFINDTDHGFLRSHLHFTLDFQRQDSTLRCIIKGPLHFHITVRLR